MKAEEFVVERVTQIWARSGNKTVRKYRCTSGTRKGRVVAKPSTCTAPKNFSKAQTLKKTKARRGGMMKTFSKRTKKYNPASKRLRTLNRPSRRHNKRKKI
jgi:hypothetical protein